MLECEITLFDKIFTATVLYMLFISDLTLTFINLYNLKKLYPRSYLTYEKNIIINKMTKRYGLGVTTVIYPVIGILLFTLFVLKAPIQPALVVGVLISLLFLIHLPNFFEIRKRLKKKC